jgi:hypothetical protein
MLKFFVLTWKRQRILWKNSIKYIDFDQIWFKLSQNPKKIDLNQFIFNIFQKWIEFNKLKLNLGEFVEILILT